MINLLPQKEKDKLYGKQLEKLVVVLGMTGFIGIICLFLILLSVKLYILGQTSSQKLELEGAQKVIKSSESINLQKIILKYNDELSRSDLFYTNQIYIKKALDILFGVSKPEGLYFTGVSVDANQSNDEGVKIIISGTSGTRDGLTIFKKNLEEEKKIKSAYFPPESWINSKNINFSITLVISKEEIDNNSVRNE